MKFNKKLLVAVLAGTLVLGSGVNAYATSYNTNNAKMLQEKVSVEVLNEILNNVDKIIEKLEKDFEAKQLEKNPKLEKLEKNTEVEKLKIEVIKERAVFDKPAVLNTEYAIGMLRRFDEAIEKIKQLKPHSDFDTKEKAEEAAKKDLETELVKNAFDLEEKDGKWHYTLKFKEIKPEQSNNSDKKEKTEEKTAEEKKQTEKEKKVDGLKNSAEKQKEEEAKKKAEEEAKKAEEAKKKAEEEAKKAEEAKKSEEMKAEAKKKAEEFKKNAEKKKATLVRKSEKVNTTTSDNKVSRPVKTTTDKKKLPKAGIEAEALTLATASLAGVLGVYTSIKKRK
ncbi:DUF5633 domain-containing protein [Finegoldia magna]|uniref:DUF5633 domain-containing protein n=1 Tax=Finegoldia magna TaxID=1260 RepID=UPI0029106FF9|nr:DUF5633 domain-containing protein [Finegoldia magna]MDU5200855.1 DUF5633 domain-containing protein [Finegoldia magna]MDU6775943.1 DUF5633 domain-containing protein [Finegoldia magna]